MADGQKTCVFCGQSCAGQPRIKDSRGSYAHRACAEARQQTEAETAVHVDNGLDDGLAGMDDLLGDLDLEEAGPAGPAVSCASCGQRMAECTVVCLGCGYNAQTGKMMSTRSKDGQAGVGGKLGEKIGGGASAVGDIARAPVLPLVGALIGGAIGAGIWAAIAYYTGFEMGIVAVLVGGLCGLGARLGGGAQTTGGGMIAGIMAATVALGSIAAGKYIAIDLIFRDSVTAYVAEPVELEEIHDDWIISDLAYDYCQEKVEQGGTIDWGDPMLFVHAAVWPYDFPEDVQNRVNEEWYSYSPYKKNLYRKEVASRYEDTSFRTIDDEWALSEIALSTVTKMIEAGEPVAWPDPNLPLGHASWPDEYPAEVRDAANEKWDSMDTRDRDAYREEIRASFDEASSSVREFENKVVKAGVINSYKRPRQLVFLVLAVIIAYGVGANQD